MELATRTCIPCQGGVPSLSESEAQEYLAQTPEWNLIDQATKIERTFSFKDFVAAMAFAQRVGQISEAEGHHPDITFGWGYCRVLFYTHKIKGLHENDFIMAAKVDALID